MLHNTSVRSTSGCLWEERLGGNTLTSDSRGSGARSLKRMGRMVVPGRVIQALPRAGFCLGPGSCMPESCRGDTPWIEGENESLREGVRW